MSAWKEVILAEESSAKDGDSWDLSSPVFALPSVIHPGLLVNPLNPIREERRKKNLSTF